MGLAIVLIMTRLNLTLDSALLVVALNYGLHFRLWHLGVTASLALCIVYITPLLASLVVTRCLYMLTRALLGRPSALLMTNFGWLLVSVAGWTWVAPDVVAGARRLNSCVVNCLILVVLLGLTAVAQLIWLENWSCARLIWMCANVLVRLLRLLIMSGVGGLARGLGANSAGVMALANLKLLVNNDRRWTWL